eukprot:jgi/Chrzof1/7358/Cz02g20260.t1
MSLGIVSCEAYVPDLILHPVLQAAHFVQAWGLGGTRAVMEICCLSRSSDSVSSALCCGLCLSVGPRWDSGWTVLQIGTDGNLLS